MKKYPLILILLIIPALSFGATCTKYVSNSGSGSTCSIGSPCAVQYAFDNGAADDVWCFRGGTYTVPAKTDGDTYSAYYHPANSGSSGHPITFQAYPGETPIFNGTATGGESWGENGAVGETIMGAGGVQYITFDGFTYQVDSGVHMARMTIGSNNDTPASDNYSTGYITVKNCTFNGGSSTIAGTDNSEGIRLNMTHHTTISNNVIYNYRQASDWHNTSGTKSYHTYYASFENNKIYNCSAGIYDKSGGHHNTYRYNWIYNAAFALYIVQNSYPQYDGAVYHNLIHTITDGGIYVDSESGVAGASDRWTVYNNTVYNALAVTGHCIFIGTTDGAYYPVGYSFYNNMVQCAGTDYGGSNVRTWLDASNGLVTMDYNDYGSSMSVRLVSGGSGTNYTTVNSLKAVAAYNLSANAHDTHSLGTAPTFTNGSGNLNLVSDFALTSGSAGHNAGSDGKDIGANVSIVGPITDTTPPTVTAFSIPATSSSLTIAITTFTATDNVVVAGYLINESASTPSVNDAGWLGTAQTTYTFASPGSKTLYAWAKDGAGNISTSLNASTTVTASISTKVQGLIFTGGKLN